jgi:hypothetical protein
VTAPTAFTGILNLLVTAKAAETATGQSALKTCTLNDRGQYAQTMTRY